MKLTQEFVQNNTIETDGYIQIETYSPSKRSGFTYSKKYWAPNSLLSNEILEELSENPSNKSYGLTTKTKGVKIWLDGDSYINYFITEAFRKRLDHILQDYQIN